MFARMYRFYKILATIWRFRLLNLVIDKIEAKPWVWLAKLFNTKSSQQINSRGDNLRLALEHLGPIFVKFGQMLSTRADMMPKDIIASLKLLQDQVPPFDSNIAIQIIEKSLHKNIQHIFSAFNPIPIASASMAQVHVGSLDIRNESTGNIENKKIAIKVLRPNMKPIIEHDLALLRNLAYWLQKIWPDVKRIKPQEIINEFDHYLHNELDLMIEAANASQLARNMQKYTQTKDIVMVPSIYFDYCSTHVLTMDWMDGIQISKTNELIAYGVDLKKLANDGIEIFFSQVFRDGFFHADMHPGNILIHVEKNHIKPSKFSNYILLDFGIMGTLSAFDKHYLAHNFLAFFERDYHRVALLHVESGWVPANVNVEALESAIRACCEPYFDKPLKDISLGLVLMRLFQTAKQFEFNIQPQLILLQKTLLNVESLGRELNPDLDLWQTAKPILQRWVSEQIGLRSLIKALKQEVPLWGSLLPQLPRLLHEQLNMYHHQQTIQTTQTRYGKNNISLDYVMLQNQKLENKVNNLIAFVFGLSFGLILVLYLWVK
jgi:ubiquinone biosynthesis protein